MSGSMSDEIKARIDAAIEKAEARGITLEDGIWGVWVENGEWTTTDLGEHKDRCCPLGALLLAEQPQVDDDDVIADVCAARVLGKDSRWVEAFIDGFDSEEPAEYRDELYGQGELREAWELGHSYRCKLK